MPFAYERLLSANQRGETFADITRDELEDIYHESETWHSKIYSIINVPFPRCMFGETTF